MSSHGKVDDELRAVVGAALAAHGYASPIVQWTQQRSPYSSSFALDAVDVRMEDGSAVALMIKDVSGGGLLSEALHAKPAFLRNPRREIDMYRRVLDAERHGTPFCHAAVADERADRYWLVLERVDGHRLAETGDFAAWEAVARWLRRFHDEFDGGAPHIESLLVYDREYYRLWLDRAIALSVDAGPRQHAVVQRLARSYEAVLDSLEALPPSLIHGEFYPLNVLLAREDDKRRVCPVDWEMAAIGPAPMDVAALTAGWDAAERRRLSAAYYGSGVGGCSSLTEFEARLDYCRLHHAVQWLGWSANWTPPAEQIYDWTNTVTELTTQLSL